MVEYSGFKHEQFTNFRYVEPISNDYEVFINGKEIKNIKFEWGVPCTIK